MKDKLYNYIKEHFTIDTDGMKMIYNIIDWISYQSMDKEDSIKALMYMLDGIGITEDEITQFIDW